MSQSSRAADDPGRGEPYNCCLLHFGSGIFSTFLNLKPYNHLPFANKSTGTFGNTKWSDKLRTFHVDCGPEATMGIMPGRPCGMHVNSTIAVLSINEHVMTRPPLSSTRCTSQFRCHRLPISSISQYHLHHILCTGRRWFTTNLMSFNTIAMKATPTGILDGLHTRSPGAVTTETWDAQEPGTAAITFTLMFLQKVLDTRKAESMTVVLASPIGCRAGQIPRRIGAAITRAGAA